MKTKKYNSQSGNVLFLILIAVALFAALSYAVTQSTRSGSGSADREKSILSGASLIQYPSALRTSVLRMVLRGNEITALQFNAPSAISNAELSVFSPIGGGGLYQNAPADVMINGNLGTWVYNLEFSVPEIGIDTPGPGNDLIAFLPGVSPSVCEQINNELNINTTDCTAMEGNVPELLAGEDDTLIYINMDDSYTAPSGTQEVISSAGASCRAFHGQPSGCFYAEDNLNQYVFYSVLLER